MLSDMKYSVKKEKGNKNWFCYEVESNKIVPDSYGDKKKTLKIAAKLNCVSLKEFLKERRKEGGE